MAKRGRRPPGCGRDEVMREKAQIMDEQAMQRALKRIAHEIIEHNKGVDNVALIGIQRRGVPLARQLRECIREIEGVELPMSSEEAMEEASRCLRCDRHGCANLRGGRKEIW